MPSLEEPSPIANATNPKKRKSSFLVEQGAHHLMASSNQQQVRNKKQAGHLMPLHLMASSN
jgi:hypothetical protein